jgi:AcrR family transcriptional regulator
MRLQYHNDMKTSRQADPRANQKARTRKALVDAAAELFRMGTPPTVADAADRARVSRATAYRYFPTQEALRVEAADLAPITAPIDAMLAALDTNDAEARLTRLLDAFNPLVIANEAPMRNALHVYLDTWLAARQKGEAPATLREGRRMRWLEAALAPVRRELTKAQWERLRDALALTLSIEALVVMRDVCRIDDDARALGVLRWAAVAMLRAALDEARAQRALRRRR